MGSGLLRRQTVGCLRALAWAQQLIDTGTSCHMPEPALQWDPRLDAGVLTSNAIRFLIFIAIIVMIATITTVIVVALHVLVTVDNLYC